jgi:hypothetical protein
MKWRKGDKARIKKGWLGEGKILPVLADRIFSQQWWVPVLDLENDEDPTYHKEAGLEKVKVEDD